jgi:hypothetical protein
VSVPIGGADFPAIEERKGDEQIKGSE